MLHILLADLYVSRGKEREWGLHYGMGSRLRCFLCIRVHLLKSQHANRRANERTLVLKFGALRNAPQLKHEGKGLLGKKSAPS
jgi:hypothetical protein